MFRKFLSMLAMSSVLLVSNALVFGQSKGDWSVIEGLANQEVAVKTGSGKMIYGVVKSISSDDIVVQTADNKRLTRDETTINRSDIKKIWRALLFVNSRNTAKGALIGAGAGAAGVGIPVYSQGSDDGLHGAGFFLGAFGGAAIGGVVGFLTKTKHNKRDLVYKN